jgi:ABC-type multidrug transport system fused ATPase/permease subunit
MQMFIFRSLIGVRKKHLEALDDRTQKLTEVVRNLHSIKLFGYERIFESTVAEKRNKEAKLVRRNVTLKASASVLAQCIPAVAAVGKMITEAPSKVVC